MRRTLVALGLSTAIAASAAVGAMTATAVVQSAPAAVVASASSGPGVMLHG